jgi:3-hydroxyacyl-CoA dehydrogenase
MAMGPQTRPAQHAIIRSVENALVLPFLAGQAMEEDLYQESLSSEDAQGNLHLLLAQRRILKLPESATAKPQKVNRLGIVGSGPAAISLVIAAAENALPTILFERDARAAKVAQERLEAALTTRKAPVGGWPAAMQHVSVTYDPAQLVESDLVTEAVADAAETKQQVMRWLADLVPAATILATHSATLAVGPTAEASGRAGQVVGMAVAPGAPRLRLAEIIPGDKTSPGAVLTLHNLLQRMGVSALRCGSHGGTIGMRMMAALRDAADYLLDLGASCGQVDGVLMQFGKANGVFAPMDMNGLETELAQASQLHHADHYPRRHLARLRDLIAEQRTGQAAGKGYYDWVDEAPVDRARDADGTQTPDTETITRLCLGAMINEGARLLREGVALRPSDIDLVMVRNHGFAAWRGGVMNAADQMGLFTLQRAMKPHGEAEPRLFAADPGIEALIRNGEGFDALNGTGPKKRSFDA